MAFGTLPTSGGGIIISSVYDPLTNTFPALAGSPMKTVDSYSNTSTGIVSGDQLQAAIMNGKGFTWSTGLFATATNPNLVMGLSVFNPLASGKSIYIYSIKWTVATANTTLNYRLTTTDPAFATTIAGLNQKPAGNSSVANATSAANAATASVTVSGTQHDYLSAGAVGTFEFLTTPGMGILLPSGAANGVAVYGTVATAAQVWGATMRGIEF